MECRKRKSMNKPLTWRKKEIKSKYHSNKIFSITDLDDIDEIKEYTQKIEEARGLKGTDIPLEGRIVALADVFDALGSDRCYKKAWPLDKVLALIEEEKGQHFDPQLVELMMANLDKFLEIREQNKDVYIGEH